MLSGCKKRDHMHERFMGISECSLKLCHFLLGWIRGWIHDTFVQLMTLKYL